MITLVLIGTGCSKDTSTSGTTTTPTSTSPDQNVLTVISNLRPDMVSGGDVLVAATPPAGEPVTFALNDADVTASFKMDTSEPTMPVSLGYLDGLRDGENSLTASQAGTQIAELTLTNHPIAGPIFSGPHQTPFVCTTEDFGLAKATDEDCSAPTTTTWRYYTTDAKATAKDLDDPARPPRDVAMIDRDGTKVPFIVRVEKGVIDRSVYEFEVLEPTPNPTAAARTWDSSAWNKRLLYEYGGGCGTGFTQGHFLGVDSHRALLAEGYANVKSTLNVFQTACNDVLSAEATMMIKEHLIESYGVPLHTIGHGGSGGSIQLHLISQNYPGLLDGIEPSLPFPDAATIAAGVTDCGLLDNFWKSDGGTAFTPNQRLAVAGHGSNAFCETWLSTFIKSIDPKIGCSPEVGAELIYDPETNPTGARCTLQDSSANLFPKTASGFAMRPLDNVGVEYGRNALVAGTITVDQFLDLNAGIGGYDDDGEFVDQREVATPEVLEAAYANGRVLNGNGNLLRIPIINANPYTDLGVDIHDRFRAFSIRDRMTTAAGSRPTNQVLWTRPGKGITELVKSDSLPLKEMIDQLDAWLVAIESARPATTPVTDADWQKLLADTRPESLSDDCVTPDGERLASDDVYDTDNACTKAYPIHGDPRTAAGAPRSNEIIKCQLEPVDASAYGAATFTEIQATRLATIFPEGICDRDLPGVGQVQPKGVWLTY